MSSQAAQRIANRIGCSVADPPAVNVALPFWFQSNQNHQKIQMTETGHKSFPKQLQKIAKKAQNSFKWSDGP